MLIPNEAPTQNPLKKDAPISKAPLTVPTKKAKRSPKETVADKKKDNTTNATILTNTYQKSLSRVENKPFEIFTKGIRTRVSYHP